jgi:hypothetical protein
MHSVPNVEAVSTAEAAVQLKLWRDLDWCGAGFPTREDFGFLGN